MKIHKYICDRFDVFTGFSTFLAVRPKNIQSTSKSSFAKGADMVATNGSYRI
jgi:hypothetical protein